LTPEEHQAILAPPRFPLGRVGIEEWLERFFPGTNIIAVFGRTRTYDDPTGWFDKLREADNLTDPLFPLLVREFRVTAQGVSSPGYIIVQLDCELPPEEAEAIAAKIYDMIAPKAEMVGIEDVPVVFVQGWIKPTTGTFKDPRDHLTTPLPLDQGFRPVPGGAQREAGGRLATIGFPVGDTIFWWDDEPYIAN
ncbi:hypothetical protein M1N47_04515, partial [Dehalococcoidia bacterium]|nr:hypothetical protein [Dehalococcoidia bacterium]